MSDVTVIGLGLMGAALAAAFQNNGKSLTVWNRTMSKCDPFEQAGAQVATNIGEALAASDLIVVCLDDYPITRSLLKGPAANGDLSRKILVQLSTGTPKEARREHAWMGEHGAAYLDGGIFNGPGAIGRDRAQILVSGDRSAWITAQACLACLGGTVRFEEGDAGTASALDLAWLSTKYGLFVSVAHACNICKAENIDIDRFIQLMPGDGQVQSLADVVRNQAFDQRTATLSVWKKALLNIQNQAVDAGINAEFPDFLAGLLDRAEKSGHGDENVMALIKVLTGKP
jgi:3-hydroxyisobutyrate dehydrogenase-like beta-hydroxyacid dehydrogenase